MGAWFSRDSYFVKVSAAKGCKHEGLDEFYAKRLRGASSFTHDRWAIGNQLMKDGWDVTRNDLSIVARCPCIKELEENSRALAKIIKS